MIEQVTARLQNITLNELEDKTNEFKTNRTTFINKALDILMAYDYKWFSYIEEYADRLKIPTGLVMQNIIISRIAQEEAERNVYGPEYTKLLLEFIYTNQGPVTGEELYKILYNNYLKDFTRQRVDVLRKKEAAGVKLSEIDLEFLAIQEFKQKRSQDDEMQNLIEQFPELEDEIKLTFEINKKG